MSELKGATTDLLYYWDDEYGWIHISEKDKLREAYERFLKSKSKRSFLISTPQLDDDFFRKWFQSSIRKAIKDE